MKGGEIMRTQKKSLFRFSVKDKDFKTARPATSCSSRTGNSVPLSRVRKLDSSTEQTKDGGTLYSPIPSLFMNKKIKIIIGLGQKRKHYRFLSKYLNIREVDWNNGSLSKMRLGKPKILVGFSL